MAETSTIEWTEATWNPITGCTLVSDGCRHCYAARLAATRLKNHPSRKGLARLNAAGEAKFTGEVRFNEEWLTQPLRWTRPRMIFVCAHGDLFHESVPDAWIDRIFAVMALSYQHTFQVLTKRPKRMREYVTSRGECRDCAKAFGRALTAISRQHPGQGPNQINHPLPNVWLGVSCEDQATADQRIPDLLATPAAIRFVSAEPLLGPIDFYATSDAMPYENHPWRNGPILQGIDQIIVGGESGDNARPMHPDWARSIRDQCKAADTAFFFKQWGTFAPEGLASEAWHVSPDGTARPDPLPNGIGRHAKEGHWRAYKVGKKAAGRLLDGVEHSEMPAPREIPAL